MNIWLQILNQELKGSVMSFCKNVNIIFHAYGRQEGHIHNALNLSKDGCCYFNLENHSNIISHLGFPKEHAVRALRSS